MATGNMEVEAAEKQLKGMTHSEQHYFNRCVMMAMLINILVYIDFIYIYNLKKNRRSSTDNMLLILAHIVTIITVRYGPNLDLFSSFSFFFSFFWKFPSTRDTDPKCHPPHYRHPRGNVGV